MRQFAIAIYAAFLAGCSFGATFVPKEYVDRMDATNRDFVIEYVNAEVGNLVRKDNGGYILATNRAMTALQQHQSLEPVSNYLDSVIGAFASTGAVARAITYGTPTRWTDATGCVWEVTPGELVWTNATLGVATLQAQAEYALIWRGDNWGVDLRCDDGVIFGSHMMVSNEWSSGDTLLAGTSDDEFMASDGGVWLEYWDPLPDYGPAFCVRLPSVTNLVGRVALTNDLPDPSASVTHETVTNIVRDISRGGIWDSQLEVWWTPIMENGALKYVATTNVDLSAEVEQ